MKSKKIIAIVLAFASLMAIATSGLAATTLTETTYLGTKVNVKSTVTGLDADQQVTYLATNSDAATEETIVYIDQKVASDGKVEFNYNVEKSKLKGLNFEVRTGTDSSTNTVEPDDADFQKFTVQLNEGVTLTGFSTTEDGTYESADTFIAGTEDKVFVKVVFDGTHEYDADTSSNVKACSAVGVYEVTDKAEDIVINAKSTVTTPAVSTPTINVSGSTNQTVVENGDEKNVIIDTAVDNTVFEEGKEAVEAVSKTAIFKLENNNPSNAAEKIVEVGVIIDNERYPALISETDKSPITSGLAAVKVIIPKSLKDSERHKAIQYHIIGKTVYKAGTSTVIGTID